MFLDYQLLVKQHYKKKQSENSLPSRLMHPTTAKLKEECLIAFAKGLLPKDRAAVVDFFGESEDDNAMLKKIKRSRPDDFRALWNYLDKDIKKPSPKNVELLAWLIGFEPRPFELGKSYSPEVLKPAVATPEAFPDVESEAGKENETPENEMPEVKVAEMAPMGANLVGEQKNDVEKRTPSAGSLLIAIKRRMNPKAVIAALLIFITGMMGIIIYLKTNREECMYWAGDHYEQIPCNQKMDRNILVVALDNEKMKFFKKITREDTITRNDIGKVWYVKIDGKMQYFTSDGNYPLDPKRKLKPLTEYIVENHIDTAR